MDDFMDGCMYKYRVKNPEWKNWRSARRHPNIHHASDHVLLEMWLPIASAFGLISGKSMCSNHLFLYPNIIHFWRIVIFHFKDIELHNLNIVC